MATAFISFLYISALMLMLVAISVSGKPLEILETSYKMLNHAQTGRSQGFQERMSLADDKPFEILEQTFRFLPKDKATDEDSSNLAVSAREDMPQARNSDIVVQSTPSRFTMRIPSSRSSVTPFFSQSSMSKTTLIPRSRLTTLPLLMQKNDNVNTMEPHATLPNPVTYYPESRSTDRKHVSVPSNSQFYNSLFGPISMPSTLATPKPVTVSSSNKNQSIKYGTPFYVQSPTKLTVTSSQIPATPSKTTVTRVFRRKIPSTTPIPEPTTTQKAITTFIPIKRFSSPRPYTRINDPFPHRSKYVTKSSLSTKSPAEMFFEEGKLLPASRNINQYVSFAQGSSESRSSQYVETTRGHGSVIPLQLANSKGQTGETEVFFDSEASKNLHSSSDLGTDFSDVGKVKPRPSRVIIENRKQPIDPVTVRDKISMRSDSISNYFLRKPSIQSIINSDETKYDNENRDEINAIEIAEEMTSEGIISYYEKLKHDIYEILNEVQKNQNPDTNNIPQNKYPTFSDLMKMEYPNHEVEPRPAEVDIDEVIDIIRNFRKHGSGNDIPESTLYDSASMILRYINDRDSPVLEDIIPTQIITTAGTVSVETPKYDRPSYIEEVSPHSDFNFQDENYDYTYVYYDEMGNEYIPKASEKLTEHKVKSPSNEFTREFLSKHTSRLSDMLTKVLRNAANNKATLIDPVQLISPHEKLSSSSVPSITTVFATQKSTEPTPITKTITRFRLPQTPTSTTPFRTTMPILSSATTSVPDVKDETTTVTTKKESTAQIISKATDNQVLEESDVKNIILGNQLFEIPPKMIYEDVVYHTKDADKVSSNQFVCCFLCIFCTRRGTVDNSTTNIKLL